MKILAITITTAATVITAIASTMTIRGAATKWMSSPWRIKDGLFATNDKRSTVQFGCHEFVRCSLPTTAT